ncbi:diaminopimelate epimerase [Tessaracoccus rhinocerotis]|uniref:Diaminopimelate epimerase n=1 Tax=Tessaracoccus rhinocerotis TaxID=1689449 RepID=A0A553JVX4_9ACTN|nr:diaminopimelate epimerase [Tessaracoccus rhinocerotis]TRY16594.1 diaminopimelate epimerase [Tessaracoccus rhinocerotis]
MRRFTFLKGQATLNDFIVIEDHHGMQDLSPSFVQQLCDRRGGIGADGLLRVVRAQHVKDWQGDPELWFMDYRNSDGSVAEMCGNGLRLFARHLMNEQLVPSGRFSVATRAGVKEVRIARGGLISVDVGRPRTSPEPVTVNHGGSEWEATVVDVGNPHAVAFVDASELSALDLSRQPTWSPEATFPDGANVEFVHETEPGRISMRVHERGSGETMSCGTGVVAAAAAYQQRTGHSGQVVVTVPGGELTVDVEGAHAWLTGPAVIHMRGEYWA